MSLDSFDHVNRSGGKTVGNSPITAAIGTVGAVTTQLPCQSLPRHVSPFGTEPQTSERSYLTRNGLW